MPRAVFNSDLPLIERLVEFSETSAYGCWEWHHSPTGNGYGKIRDDAGRYDFAHRASYRAFKGEIPDGLCIDHLCRNRCCVNPDHLEAVTWSENIRRGLGPIQIRAKAASATHCARGHEYTPDAVRQGGSKSRRCLICKEIWLSKYIRIRGSRRFIGPPHPDKYCKNGHLLTPPIVRSDGTIVARKCAPCLLKYKMERQNIRRRKIREGTWAAAYPRRGTLTDDQVIAIRTSSLTHRELVEIYGVSHSTIGDIRRGRTHKSVGTDHA